MSCYLCGGNRYSLFCRISDRLPGLEHCMYRVLRCRDCGLGWTWEANADRLPDPIYPADYWGDVAGELEAVATGRWKRGPLWRAEAEKVRLVERFLPGGKLLDVGAGIGKFLLALDPSRWRAEGIEDAAHVVGQARRRFPRLSLYPASIETFTPNHAYDVITLWHVFEHLRDPRTALRRLRSWLGPGGLLVVSLPNLDSWQADWFRENWFPFGEGSRHPFHYSPESLSRLLREEGLDPVRCLFFSRRVSLHCWKAGRRRLLRESPWSPVARILRPLVYLGPGFERLAGRWGIFTLVATPRRS
ncbi:MAG: class I SAM-dependent methyltransferase [Acidobacteriota bacterium]